MLRVALVGTGDAGEHHARALTSLEEVFAFPLHIEAARRFFAERSITGDHAYVQA